MRQGCMGIESLDLRKVKKFRNEIRTLFQISVENTFLIAVRTV